MTLNWCSASNSNCIFDMIFVTSDNRPLEKEAIAAFLQAPTHKRTNCMYKHNITVITRHYTLPNWLVSVDHIDQSCCARQTNHIESHVHHCKFSNKLLCVSSTNDHNRTVKIW